MKQPELDLFGPPALGAPEWIGKQTLLLPFTRAFVPTVDIAAGRIIADPPEETEE